MHIVPGLNRAKVLIHSLKRLVKYTSQIRQAMKVHLILQNHDRIQSMNKAGALDTATMTRLVSGVSLHSCNVCTRSRSGDPV